MARVGVVFINHFNNWHRTFSLLLIMMLFTIQIDQFVSSDNLRACGTIFSRPKSKGIALPLKDANLHSDLAEDHGISGSGWTETGSIVIENGCRMEVCNETYLDGDCHVLEHGSHSVKENGFLDAVASAQCTCDKQCRCSDAHIKKSSCGRAYLDGGCNRCNALYYELDQNQSPYFPYEFLNGVTAIHLRKGCRLRYYSEEEFEGEEQILDQEITEAFQDPIGSYECECNDGLYVPNIDPPRPASYPTFANIPDSLEEIQSLLKNDTYRYHAGLNAAVRSLQNGRSSRNAYILVIGSAGAGKSSAIRLLLGNPNVTNVDMFASSSLEIREIRIAVPIDELGVSNSELRIIDTPGLGDTRGVTQDAKLLATLEQYLANHEELKDRIPNVVLIFHKFNDNRITGESSRFVKMLRGLSMFSKRITDQKRSNVVFVLSHFCSETKKTKRQPGAKLALFRQAIKEYGQFPKPVHVVVAENMGKLEELPMVNGNFKLPNKEYYPRNLVEKLELVTEMGGDMIGRGVFRNAFQNLERLNVSRQINYPILSGTGNEEKYLRGLLNAPVGVLPQESALSPEISGLMASIAELKAELAAERKARKEDFENFKSYVLAEQLSLVRETLQPNVVAIIRENMKKARNDIWKKLKVDLKKLFE